MTMEPTKTPQFTLPPVVEALRALLEACQQEANEGGGAYSPTIGPAATTAEAVLAHAEKALEKGDENVGPLRQALELLNTQAGNAVHNLSQEGCPMPDRVTLVRWEREREELTARVLAQPLMERDPSNWPYVLAGDEKTVLGVSFPTGRAYLVLDGNGFSWSVRTGDIQHSEGKGTYGDGRALALGLRTVLSAYKLPPGA